MALQALYDLPAPAKLNVFLHITGRRADGYHELATVLAALAGGDSLELEPAPATRVQASLLPGGDAIVTRALDLLAALSHHANFSVGCYCEDEAHCHRSVLRSLLEERGAKLG